MDTVGLRVPTKQIRAFIALTSAMSQDLALQQGASRLQNICRSLDVFNKLNISVEDTFSLA
jgi:hypothetical protein